MSDNVKNDMKCLWKRIFGDSDEYIDMFFNRYYDDVLFDRLYINNVLVSQLCCVGYDYMSHATHDGCNVCSVVDNSDDTVMRAGYLCGLSTLPEYRGMGYMNTLMRKSDRRLYDLGYSVSFLVPADDSLRSYYGKSGYVDISFAYHDRYVLEHVFCNDLMSEHTDDEYIDMVHVDDINYSLIYLGRYMADNICNAYDCADDKLLCNLYSQFIDAVRCMRGIVIRHSYDDFITIIQESVLSGGEILFLRDCNNKLSGFLFCSANIEGEVTVQLLVAESEESENILLQSLKNLLADDVSVNVRRYDGASPSSEPEVLDVAVGSQIDSADFGYAVQKKRFPFAMAKILNVSEILKFASRLYPDSEYSILVKCDDIAENEGLYVVRNAEVSFTPLAELSDVELERAECYCRERLDWYALSVPELASILWRDTYGERVVNEAVVIPCLPLAVFLMLE